MNAHVTILQFGGETFSKNTDSNMRSTLFLVLVLAQYAKEQRFYECSCGKQYRGYQNKFE
jgi:hypothetical protein